MIEEVTPVPESKLSSKNIVSFFLLALLFAAPLAVSLSPGVFLEAGKWVVLMVLSGAAFFSFAYSVIKTRELRVPKSPMLGSLSVVLLSSFFSALFSGFFWASFFGDGYGVAPFFSLLLFSLIAYLFSVYFITRESLMRAASVFLASSILVVLSTVLHNAYSDIPLLSLLAEPTANVFGKWTDLGALCGLLLMGPLFLLELPGLHDVRRFLLAALFSIGLLGVAIVNAPSVWFFVASAALFLLAYRFRYPKEGEGRRVHRRAAAVLIFAFVFMNFGKTPILGQFLVRFQIPAADAVQPTLGSTFGLFDMGLTKKAAWGVGPTRFGNEWFLSRPGGVNQSPYWGSYFNFGFGFIPTTFVTGGLLGFGTWLLFLAALFSLAVRTFFAWKRGEVPSEWTSMLFLLFLCTVYLWYLSLVTVPGTALFFLAFVFTGLLAGALQGAGLGKEAVLNLNDTGRKERLAFGLFVLVGTLMAWRVPAAFSMYGAEKEYALARDAERRGEFPEAVVHLKEALRKKISSEAFRGLAEISIARLELLVASSKDPAPSQLLEFKRIAGEAINSARGAVVYDAGSYFNWYTLGNVYQYLYSLGIADAGDLALDAYTQADLLFPTSPAVPLAVSRVKYVKGERPETRKSLMAALARKPDYAPALLMLAQLDAQEGRSEEAIASAEKALKVAPNNPEVLFQIGILHYIKPKPDYVKARDMFARLVDLVPSYANARYFLALSQAGAGELQVALDSLVELQKENPGNVELGKAIANIKVGRPADQGIFPALPR